MKSKSTLFTLLFLNIFILFGPLNVASAQSDFVESGFIQDYSRLTADPERPNVRLFIAPDADMKAYEKIFLADVVIFLHPQSEYQGISVKKMAQVSNEFKSYAEQNLTTRREIVSEVIPGDKTVVLRLAISNVYAKRPKRNALNYTPIGLASTGIKKAAGRDYALATAALEVELLDGETGKVLAALVATQLGETLAKAKSGDRKWSDVQAYLRNYADTLSNHFN